MYNKHIIKHRLLDHAKQTSIDKGILKVGGSDDDDDEISTAYTQLGSRQLWPSCVNVDTFKR